MAETRENRNGREKTDFVWTDEEIQLLLEAVIVYKSGCEYAGICWESVKTKYNKIMEIFVDRYPEPNQTNIVEFPRAGTPGLLTQERIAAKLKRIRSSYKKAVDAGRRSGGGRVVLTFYDLCESVWGGSPAVESLLDGIDSSASVEVRQVLGDNSASLVDNDIPSTDNSSDVSALSGVEDNGASDAESENHSTATPSTKDRRAKIADLLKNRRDSKMTNKINCETQMLNFTKEDLNLKRKIAGAMERSDNEFSETITKVNKTMESIGDSIKQGFGLIAEVMKQTQAPSTSGISSPYFNYHTQSSQANQHFMHSYYAQQQLNEVPQPFQPQYIPFVNSQSEEPEGHNAS